MEEGGGPKVAILIGRFVFFFQKRPFRLDERDVKRATTTQNGHLFFRCAPLPYIKCSHFVRMVRFTNFGRSAWDSCDFSKFPEKMGTPAVSLLGELNSSTVIGFQHLTT